MSKPVSGNSTRVSSLSRHCGRYQHSAPTRHDRNQRQHREAEDTTRRLSGYAAEQLCTLGNNLQVVGHLRPVWPFAAPLGTQQYPPARSGTRSASGARPGSLAPSTTPCTWTLARGPCTGCSTCQRVEGEGGGGSEHEGHQAPRDCIAQPP
jgi:hypothetical protein